MIQTITVLSLPANTSSYLLPGKSDIDAILPRLPSTLRSLSLKGSKIYPSQIPLLTPLVQHLEELALGQGLELGDIHRLLYQDQQWTPHSLRYLDMSDLNVIIGSASVLLAPASAPLHVIELEEHAYKRARRAKQNLERVGWTILGHCRVEGALPTTLPTTLSTTLPTLPTTLPTLPGWGRASLYSTMPKYGMDSQGVRKPILACPHERRWYN